MSDKTLFIACFFKEFQEKVSAFSGTQLRLSTIAAAGYKVQFLITVIAGESFGHPVREFARRDGECDPDTFPLVSPHIRKRRVERECVGHPRITWATLQLLLTLLVFCFLVRSGTMIKTSVPRFSIIVLCYPIRRSPPQADTRNLDLRKYTAHEQ